MVHEILHKRVLRSLLAALVISVSLSIAVAAVPAAPPPPATAKDVADPVAFLARFPKGGPAMASYVARSVTKDPSLVDAIVAAAEKATRDQASAMGAGFARAARALAPSQPKIVQALTETVMRSPNLPLKISFRAIGPNHLAFGPLIMPPDVTMKMPSNTQVGAVYPGESRIGPPAENPPVYTWRYYKDDDQMTETVERSLLGNERMITAILATQRVLSAVIGSGPAQNGATSTSPTI